MERRLFFYTVLAFLLLSPFSGYSSIGDSTKIAELNSQGRSLAHAGDFDGAVNIFHSILDIDSNDVKANNNLGTVYKILGRYNDALVVLHDVADLVIKRCGVDCEELASIYTNIGNIYNIKQDYELALQYFTYAERIVHVNSLTSGIATSVYNNIGNVYFYMKDRRKALNSYKRGIEVKMRLNSGGLDVSYANCASTYEDLGILDSARMYYELSIMAKFEQYNSESHYLINVYNNYSVLLQKLGEDEESRHYLSMALGLAELHYSAKHPVISECHRYLGDWYLYMDQPESALAHFQKAISAVVFDFYADTMYSNPSLESEILSEPVLMEALRGKAGALSDLYKQDHETTTLIASLETLEIASLLAEKMRSMYMSQESKLFITESAHADFAQAVNTAFDLYEITGLIEYANKAFIYAEKGKSSVLLASLQEVENKKNLMIPAEIQISEEEIKNETEVYKKRLYEERQRAIPDSSKLGIWQGKLISLSQQLDSLNNVIRDKFPEYALKYNNEVIDLAGVKEGLDVDQALVEYSFTDTSMFIFLIERDTHFISRISIGPDFYTNVDVLSQFLRFTRGQLIHYIRLYYSLLKIR